MTNDGRFRERPVLLWLFAIRLVPMTWGLSSWFRQLKVSEPRSKTVMFPGPEMETGEFGYVFREVRFQAETGRDIEASNSSIRSLGLPVRPIKQVKLIAVAFPAPIGYT